MHRRALALGLILSSALAGCANVPDLNLTPLAGRQAAPGETASGKVNRIVDRVVCELSLAKASHPELADYVAVAQLSLKVEDTGGLTPSLTIINPLAIAGTSRSTLLGGEVTRGRLRSFTQNFTVTGRELPVTCSERPGSSLTGDIGLIEVVKAGLDARHAVLVRSGTRKSEDSHFASTIQFSSKLGAFGGPGITDTDLKGYGGNLGLGNYSRVGTDLLTIAFIHVPPGQNIVDEEAAIDRAVQEGRALINRILLENLILPR